MNSVQNSPYEISYYWHRFDEGDIDGLEPKSLEEVSKNHPGFLISVDKIYRRTILMLAAYTGNAALVKFLIDKTDSNYLDQTQFNGDTALVEAVQCYHKDKGYQCAKLLLEAGANPNITRKKDGSSEVICKTPLYEAVQYKMDKVIDLLLDYSAVYEDYGNSHNEEPVELKAIRVKKFNTEWEKARLLLLAHKKPGSSIPDIPPELVQEILKRMLPAL